MTYANATRWHAERSPVTADIVRLALWTVFLANWTGRHEWHTAVAWRQEIEPRSSDLRAYGESLQDEALLDGTTAFIVHAHAVKTSVAATQRSTADGIVAAARRDSKVHGRPEARTLRSGNRDQVDRLPVRQSPAGLTQHSVHVRVCGHGRAHKP